MTSLDFDPCPACGREVERWTNMGRLPPHGKRRVRHKCPHGVWCPQGHPLWGTHSNGRTQGGSNVAACKTCNDEREAKLLVERTRPRDARQALLFIEFGDKGTRMARPAKLVPLKDLVEPHRKPDRVWTLFRWTNKNTPPVLPFQPQQRVNAWLEDYIHDWNIVAGMFRYASRVTDEPVWVLLEYGLVSDDAGTNTAR